MGVTFSLCDLAVLLYRFNEAGGTLRALFFTPGAAWVDSVDVTVSTSSGLISIEVHAQGVLSQHRQSHVPVPALAFWCRLRPSRLASVRRAAPARLASVSCARSFRF
mgnify:CR=1 FL=1